MKFIDGNYPELGELYRRMYRSFQPGAECRRSLKMRAMELASGYSLRTSILE